MKINASALVFPGQGSQRIGMGKDLYTNFAVAKEVFDKVDEALSFKLSSLMFDGDIEELNKTSNAQPAIMTVSLAYFEVLKSLGIIDLSDVKFMAGHSLGEYSALCAAGVLTLENTANLLKYRGLYMMDACVKNPGAMAAIIGFDFEKAKMIADAAGCFVGNSNSPAQIVLSGSADTVEKACVLAKEQGAKRAILLPVSGAFHSPLMQSAADKMTDILNQTKFAQTNIKVVSNLTAKEYNNTDEMKDLLIKQITNTVKWQESVAYMVENGVEKFVEVGYGNVLTGLIKKTFGDIEALSVEEILKTTAEAV